jgi:hypothetical protein
MSLLQILPQEINSSKTNIIVLSGCLQNSFLASYKLTTLTVATRYQQVTEAGELGFRLPSGSMLFSLTLLEENMHKNAIINFIIINLCSLLASPYTSRMEHLNESR